MKLQITICGGGNAAHTLIGLLGGQPDLAVQVYAPYGQEAERWQASLNGAGVLLHTPSGDLRGRPQLASAEAEPAVSGSQIVILALPAFAHADTLAQIAPYLEPGAWVGAMPARGGFDLAASAALGIRAGQGLPSGEGLPTGEVALFGLQTLPWACRIQHYAREAVVLGAKAQVDLAAWPASQAPAIAAQLGELLGVRLHPVASFLSLTLADTGQLIHPGIMYGLFHAWDGQPYPEPPPFYQGVDAEIAATLAQMSAEVQALRANLEQRYPALDLSAVRPLGEWLLRSYRETIADPSSLQTCFTTNRSYAGLLAPMRPSEGGFVPDFQSRYLAEDVPFNLLATRGLAELAEAPMPVIDRVLAWAQAQLGKTYLVDGQLQGAGLAGTRAPQRYQLSSLDEYLRRLGTLPGSLPDQPTRAANATLR